MADKVEKILDIKVNYNEAIKAIAEYQTKIDKAKEAEAKLKEQLKAGDIKRQQYNEEMAASKAYINDCNDSIRVITKTMQNQLKQEKAQENSLVSLRAKLSNLTAEYDALSEAERNAATGIKLRDKINEVTDALKDAEEETQRYYRNVGNYKEAIMEAANANIPFVQQINVMVTSLGGVKNYISNVNQKLITVAKTTTGLTRVVKLLGTAMLGLGIGALLVVLASLVSWFTKTQKGVEAANKIMGALGATVNVLIDRAGKLGSALVNLFTGNFKQAGNDAKSIFAGIGDEIVNETKQAWKLAEVLNEIDKREVMLSMSRAANRAEIEKLKKAADDQTLSTQERIKAAEKAAEIEKKDLAVQTELAEARLANTLGFTEMNNEVRKLMEQIKAGDITADEVIGKLGLSDSTIEDLKVFRDQFNELQELMEDSYGRQTEQQNTLNSIRQEGADKAKEAKQTELEAVRAAEDAMLALVKDKREQARKEIELNYSRQIEDLQISLKQEENLTAKAREAINAKIKALLQQKSMELSKLSDEELKKELENRLKMISLQLESVKEGSEQEYQLKIQQLQAQQEAELTSTEQTEEMKLAIKAKYNTKIDELATAHEQNIINKQQEAMRIRFETEIAQAYDNEEEILRIRMEQKKAELDSLQQMEGESIEAFNLRKLEAQNAYLESKKELSDKEIEIETKKTEALSALAGNLSNLINQAAGDNEEMARLAKVLAIAEIAIAQGVAIAQAVKTATSSSATWIDMLVAIGTVVSAVTAVMGTAMKSVKSAKFAEGGLVTGPGTGTSDSIPAQLSNGESVITAKATSMFAPILSSFNMMGGGVPINVTATNNQTLGEDMLARAVAKGMMMAPAPVVSVEEFTSVANRIKYIEESGSL